MPVRERLAALGERHVFGRKRFQPAFERLHQLALTGLNYGVDDPTVNGEYALLDRLSRDWSPEPVVFDAGGHRGEWSAAVLERAPGARVYTFEPNRDSFEAIRARLGDRIELQPFALGAEEGTAALSSPAGIPEMGSLHQRDLAHLDMAAESVQEVRVRTVDGFCAEAGIEHVDLLKLDVEGHELAALRGAREMLQRRAIAAVQFEFGGTAIDAGVHLRDLLDELSGYRVHRIVRDGLQPIDRYDERDEVFLLSNFAALR